MPKHTIPLILPFTARGWAASTGTTSKDQQLINGFCQIATNPLAQRRTVYSQKRAGSTTGTTIGTSPEVMKYYNNKFAGGIFCLSDESVYALVGGTYTDVGTLSGQGQYGADVNRYLPDGTISDKGLLLFGSAAGSGSGFFLFSDAMDTDLTFPTFTGNRTSGSAVISGIADTTGIYKGQAISGTGIPADTRVLSVDSSTQITMSANATSGAGTSTTITKEALARITDADFPTELHGVDFMDGYTFAGAANAIQHSAINDPASWAAADSIGTDYMGDTIKCIFKWLNYIVAVGEQSGTWLYFYNAGNSTGSVLSAAENLTVQGICIDARPISMKGAGYFIGHAPITDIGTGNSPPKRGLYRLTGVNSIEKVSDDLTDVVINDTTGYELDTMSNGGKDLLLVSERLMYDPDTGLFSPLADITVRSSFAQVFTKASETAFFIWSVGNTWTDSSSAYTLTAQTEPIYLGGEHGGTDISIELIADTEASGEATLDVSDDDYATWRTVGTFDMTKAKKILWGGGWHRGARAYRVTHSANTNFRAQALVVEWR